MNHLIFLSFFIFLLLPFDGHAAETIQLKDLVKSALNNNHLVSGAKSEKAAAEAGIHASLSKFTPRVTFEERASLTDSGTKAFMMKLDQGRFSLSGDLNHPSITGDFQTTVSIEQALMDLSLSRSTEVAKEEYLFRQHSEERVRQETAFQVYAALLNLQKAKSHLSACDSSLKDAQEQKRIATVRGNAGTGLKYDELRMSTFLAEQEQLKITAENDVSVALLRIEQLTGVQVTPEQTISTELILTGAETSFGTLEFSAFANRPDLLQASSQVSKADAGVSAIKGSFWPTLYAGASYQMNDRDMPLGRDNDSWMAAATLRWEIFDSIRRKSDLQKAMAFRNASESYRTAMKQEIAVQIRESLLRKTESAKRLEVARSALKDAEEMVRLINKRFENALATTSEILDAQTALNRIRAQLADNEADHLLATARVYHNAGLFLKEVDK